MNKVIKFFIISTLITKHCFGDTLIPQNTNDELLNKTYTNEEKVLIKKDLNNIKDLCFNSRKSQEKPIYLATAGAPGACKSTILETYLHDQKVQDNFVYADPDQRSLKFMINTYYQSLTCYEIKKYPNYQDILKNAYTKWRDASNYIANNILNYAFEGKYNIAHGTTSTSSVVSSLYKKLKEKDYKIILLLCNAPDETITKALENRAQKQGFVQVAQDDITKKAKMFTERFPTYFEYADEIHIYWTQDFLVGSVHAATYRKGKGLVVHNNEALQKFTEKYDNDRKNKNLPSLNDLAK
jgi:predicted ABC-type ATPase